MLTYYHEKHRLNSILALEKILKKQHDSNMSMSNIYVRNCECKKPRKYYFCFAEKPCPVLSCPVLSSPVLSSPLLSCATGKERKFFIY